MARDFLSVAASGVGVERLFNSARDVCSYRRGQLNSSTIEKLMLQLTTDRFLVKEEYHQIQEENMLVDETDDPNFEEDELVYISEDDEYNEDGEDGEDGKNDEGEGRETGSVLGPQATIEQAHRSRPHRVQHTPGQYRAMAAM